MQCGLISLENGLWFFVGYAFATIPFIVVVIIQKVKRWNKVIPFEEACIAYEEKETRLMQEFCEKLKNNNK